MNYRYDNLGLTAPSFYITERATGYVVAKGLSGDDARKLTKRLNSGAGFNGWTPEFMLQQIKISPETE